MDKVECAGKMKAALQQMGLWPNVDVLNPDVDARHKHVIFVGEAEPTGSMVSATKKMQFFDAMAAENIFPRDMAGFGFADIPSVNEGETLRETPIIVRFSQIERALRPEQGQGAARRP